MRVCVEIGINSFDSLTFDSHTPTYVSFCAPYLKLGDCYEICPVKFHSFRLDSMISYKIEYFLTHFEYFPYLLTFSNSFIVLKFFHLLYVV